MAMTIVRSSPHFKTVWLDMTDTLDREDRSNHVLRIEFLFDCTMRLYPDNSTEPHYLLWPVDVHFVRTDKLWERMTKEEKRTFAVLDSKYCDDVDWAEGMYEAAAVDKQRPKPVEVLNNDRDFLDEMKVLEDDRGERAMLRAAAKEYGRE